MLERTSKFKGQLNELVWSDMMSGGRDRKEGIGAGEGP